MQSILLHLWARRGVTVSDFLLSWAGALKYTFPPTSLIHKVLLKIKRDKADVNLVTPTWLRQHWFSTLLEISIVSPAGASALGRLGIAGQRPAPTPGLDIPALDGMVAD